MLGTIVVVADTCTDQTASLAENALGGQGEVLECQLGKAGASRRLATEWFLAQTTHPSSRIWIAASDADSFVPSHWLATQLRFAEAGAAAVAGAGRLDPLCDASLSNDSELLFRAS